jgi:hypothetical protein
MDLMSYKHLIDDCPSGSWRGRSQGKGPGFWTGQLTKSGDTEIG